MTNVSKVFAAMADPTRRKVFERLSKGPQAVVDLADRLPVTRPAVSQHLKVLMEAGLVSVHQRGTRRLYQIDPKGVMVMRDYLENMWDTALHAFKLAAEREEKGK